MALTETELPEDGLAILTGMIGLITWSSALTDNVDVVAASHNVMAELVGCCCVAAVVDAVCGCWRVCVGGKGAASAERLEGRDFC